MSESSFPFLKLARERGLDYGDVLVYAAAVAFGEDPPMPHREFLTPIFSRLGVDDLAAIAATVHRETVRRISIKVTRQ